MSGKNSSHNIPEKGTDSSGEALLEGKDVLVILPTTFGKSLIYQVFSIAQTFANISTLIISPLNLNSIVEEQTKEMNGLGITLVHSNQAVPTSFAQKRSRTPLYTLTQLLDAGRAVEMSQKQAANTEESQTVNKLSSQGGYRNQRNWNAKAGTYKDGRHATD